MDEAASHDGREEEDEEEYEEVGGGSRLLGFMFGNVDYSGDLDADYLDEDAKEHLSALADKLGPSLTDMDLIKSSPATTDASEQDFYEKAEDAVDYEDIDEQYDGPEIQAATEEDHLLPRKEYFSSDAFLSSLNSKTSIFDEEDYDEDDEMGKDSKIKEKIEEVEELSLAGGDLEVASAKSLSLDDDMPSGVSLETEEVALEPAVFQEDEVVPEEPVNSKSETALPVLCVEDGLVILRFSEIFGVHEPLKRPDRRKCQKRPSCNERDKTLDITNIIEEDEEAFLRSADNDLSITKRLNLAVLNGEEDNDQEISFIGVQNKDICLGSQPMKDDIHVDASAFQCSLPSPKFYPLDQQDWEDGIIWGNSPQISFDVSRNDSYSEHDTEDQSEENLDSRYWRGAFKSDEKDGDCPVGSADNSILTHYQSLERECHQQLLGSELFSRRHSSYSEVMKMENVHTDISERTALQRFDRLSLKNNDLLNGSWLDHIIWDSEEAISKPKLILDLQDEQMQFEIVDYKDSEYLSSRAGAMVVVRPSKSNSGESSDVHNQGMPSNARFNISNDKYYSNRKISQQAKSHTKKRASHGIKGLHSVPALRLQTMKPKLSNKEIANFHRPKALWYPRDNEIAAKAQGALITNGPIKVVIMTLAGKGAKLHVDAEETLSSVKLKTSKKLEFKMSEKVKIIYSGRELEDDKFLAFQGVRPNSVLHLVRTRIQIWPKAQRLPGENKPRRPPGAFKKKSELSVKDGHVFLMEYCEERPLLLGNVGMGARFCTYYQKLVPNDQTASTLRNVNNGLGTVLTLDPSDRSPFLGDIGPGCSQSCLETNMYRSPIFPHKLPHTDYLLVRSAKGALSLRRIDRLYAVGQQEPHMEVLSPGSKNVQSYLVNRMLVYVYRQFRANEKPGIFPSVRADELAALFPGLTDAFMRKRLKLCADLKKGAWVKRIDFRIPSEEELRRMLAPENVCSYESMQAGLYRLKRLGISRLTHPIGLSSAMNQLPDEAITLAAASHIERELQITSWNLTSNFVACTNQDRENIERLEITGVGDPSGRGLGFSYVRVTPKAPITSAVVKKKVAASKGGSTVTGTDADLRRLSMDAAREVLLKFKVPEEQIDKLTRWHRIALVRKLSSEQAATGVKVEAMTLSKFARGQRMSFLQLQQQTREKCQEIWDRQVQSLSATNDDENESDSEANSDLDSFAGDLENLLDAEEFEEEVGNGDVVEKADVAKGLKMRRCHSFSQTEEEIEDAKAEAVFIRRLLDDDESEIEKKKKSIGIEVGRPQLVTDTAGPAKKLGTAVRQILSSSHPDGSHTSKELMTHESREVENSPAETNSWKSKAKKGIVKNDMAVGLGKKNYKTSKDGTKVFKEKKHADRRESFVCGACGQLGHMRTNKNCPKYGEDAEPLEIENASVKSHLPDGAHRSQLKVLNKKMMPTLSREAAEETTESLEKQGMELQVKVPPLKFKCGSADKPSEKTLSVSQTFDKLVIGSMNREAKQAGKNLIIPIKMKGENVHPDTPKPTVRILPPQGMDKEPPKKIVIKQPKFTTNKHAQDFDIAIDHESRKMKKIAELSPSFDKQRKLESHLFLNDEIGVNRAYDRRIREEKGRNMQRLEEERIRRMIEERRNYEAAIRREEHQHAKKKKAKKNKKKRPDFSDEYLMDHRPYRTDRRFPERDRAAKRRNISDAGLQEYAPPTKRRRGGEVILSNILESIVDQLRDNIEISYLFIKPVTKKEAPDYFDVIKSPMDLSTIRDKVRNLEYKRTEDFRHDVWQIAFNAHKYNDRRNPGIPPLADQLLELCDYLIHEKDEILTNAEAQVEPPNI
ncbi:hypothetical protein IEQ34_005967 [Dendrobium chrysotoxum]|uniref:Transcription initiation factor TFIID subunit 1 n=1 Tax=Dendrobium chrysotoxum TaxID=161865 RepID=A0AAV7HCT2_DENCH|nr:hypothetical protein IEQ34_005967 [Dendrobium chrysotoxum]